MAPTSRPRLAYQCLRYQRPDSNGCHSRAHESCGKQKGRYQAEGNSVKAPEHCPKGLGAEEDHLVDGKATRADPLGEEELELGVDVRKAAIQATPARRKESISSSGVGRGDGCAPYRVDDFRPGLPAPRAVEESDRPGVFSPRIWTGGSPRLRQGDQRSSQPDQGSEIALIDFTTQPAR